MAYNKIKIMTLTDQLLNEINTGLKCLEEILWIHKNLSNLN